MVDCVAVGFERGSMGTGPPLGEATGSRDLVHSARCKALLPLLAIRQFWFHCQDHRG